MHNICTRTGFTLCMMQEAATFRYEAFSIYDTMTKALMYTGCSYMLVDDAP